MSDSTPGGFAENLSKLEPTDNCARLELLDAAGSIAGVIENKPGSQGSLKVYCHLAKKWGAINADAAREGLELYAEHTADARNNPGKHLNIDRLFEVIAAGRSYSVRCCE